MADLALGMIQCIIDVNQPNSSFNTRNSFGVGYHSNNNREEHQSVPNLVLKIAMGYGRIFAGVVGNRVFI